MFIALTIPIPVRSGGAPCAVARSVYMPLLTERDRLGIRELGAINMLLLRSKNPSISMMTTFCAKPRRASGHLSNYRS